MILKHRTGNLSGISCVHYLPAQGIKTSADIGNYLSMLQTVCGNAIDVMNLESSLSSGLTLRQV
jgi:hypothetical protein